VTVRYVDGAVVNAPVADWPRLRSDGVDYADLVADDGAVYRVQGRSVYWLYPVGGGWVLGGGTVGGSESIVDVAYDSGLFKVHHPEYMPDLAHDRVKLGWWDR
jgi:hypothetical protein